MNKLIMQIKKVTSSNSLYYLVILISSVLPFAKTGTAGYFNRGDLNFPLFIKEFFSDSLFLWNHGYMTGQADISNYFTLWPSQIFLYFLNIIGFSQPIAQRLFFVLMLFFLGASFYYFFVTVFSKIFTNKLNLKLSGLTSSIFVIYNPYIFNIIIGGQKEYIFSLGAIILFFALIIKSVQSNDKGTVLKSSLYAFLAAFSSTLALTGNLANIVNFIVLILVFYIYLLIFYKKRAIRAILLSVIMVILLNSWWIFSLGTLVLHNNLFSSGMSIMDADSYIKQTSPENFIHIIRLHYGRLGSMYPLTEGLNRFFLSSLNITIGITLFIISISFFAFKKARGKIHFLFLFSSLLLLINLQRGFYSPLFMFLWDNLTIFSIFRNPYKFAQFYLLTLSLLLGISTYYILSKLGQKNVIARLGFFSFLITLILINVSPMLSGDFYRQMKPINIPTKYLELRERDLSNTGRILVLPQTRGVVKYDWSENYAMIPISDKLFQSPVVEVKHTSLYNNLSQKYLEKTLKSESKEAIVNSWKKLNVRYILKRLDLDTNQVPVEIIHVPSEEDILNSENIKLIEENNLFKLYEIMDFMPKISTYSYGETKPIDFSQVNPSKYSFSLDLTDPTELIFLESFSKNWNLYFDDSSSAGKKFFSFKDISYLFKNHLEREYHSVEFDYANKYSLDPYELCPNKESCTINGVLYFSSQSYAYIGLFISLFSLALIPCYFLILSLKRRPWKKESL